MMLELTAVPLQTLPESFRHRGKPSAWAEMTRPGHKMHSFLEGAFFDVDQNLWLSDVPYGRVFRISPEGYWEVMHEIDGCLLYTSPSPRDRQKSRMPSSA